jgi:hypothetical protein
LEEGMTDPTGRSFLSYRRTCADEASLLIAAQHDLGIPTWRDVDDLDEMPTEDEIRDILKDPRTANAILWLTPDLREASPIFKAEVRLALERVREDERFFVIPALARGLAIDEVDKALGQPLMAEVLRTWNLRVIGHEPIDPSQAFQLASRVLRRRIQSIHRTLPGDQPLKLALYTRKRAPFRPGEIALSLDWRDRFGDLEADPTTWETHLLPALRRVADEIGEKAHGRSVEAEGLAALPALIALGCAFLRPRKIRLAWRQYMVADGSEQMWSLDAAREPSGFSASLRSQEDRGTDLAVLVSVNEDVTKAFAASLPDLPRFRAVVIVEKKGVPPERTGPPHTLATPGQAVDLVWTVIESVKEARRTYPEIECIHLFMATPAGVAVMVGQLLNTLGSIQTYQHVGPDTIGRYRPAARLAAWA